MRSEMILGIDASNIRAGGGMTHLQKILDNAEPEVQGISQVVVWGGRATLDQLTQESWLDLRETLALSKPLHMRLRWQVSELSQLARKNCDILFSPGGLYLGGFRPYVTMFQNMQIFETKEKNRENGKEWLRLSLLQWAQGRTFQKASGLICLSEYACNYLTQYHPKLVAHTPLRLIAHGTESSQDRPVSLISNNKFLRILYVSTVKKYKHQWNLVDAIGLLKKDGLSVELHLVGGGDAQAINWMQEAINRNDPDGNFVFYHGNLSYEETLLWYHKADMFVFPSTCETFGISLLEAMTAGLTIASSARGPLSEVLKDAGLYFNPESVISIKNCLTHLIENPALRQKLGKKAQHYSQTYSWKKCANETFSFLRKTYEENKK